MKEIKNNIETNQVQQETSTSKEIKKSNDHELDNFNFCEKDKLSSAPNTLDKLKNENEKELKTIEYTGTLTTDHSGDSSKFTGNNFNKAKETRMNETYAALIANGVSEAEANYHSLKEGVYYEQKKTSTAKFSDEGKILKHADARAQQQKLLIMKNGGSVKEQEKAYKDEFIRTYLYDNTYNESRIISRADKKGEEAIAKLEKKYNDGLVSDKNLNKEKAKAYNKAYLEVINEKKPNIDEFKPQITKDSLDGKNFNQIKPGSKYFEKYTSNLNSEVKIWHGEKINRNLNVVESDKNKSSEIYLSPDRPNASLKQTQIERALPINNSAKYTHEVSINAKNNKGTNVFAIESKVAPQIHNPYVFGKDAYGGGNQFVLTTAGKFDNSTELVINEKQNLIQKEKYFGKLNELGANVSSTEIDEFGGRFEKVDTEYVKDGRKHFAYEKEKLINQWQDLHNKQWPRYEENILNEKGEIIRHKGDKYDAHHIQPLEMGGRNIPENITPLHIKDHISKEGIHSSDEYKKLIKNEMDLGK